MTEVSLRAGRFEVDAGIVAEGLRLTPEALRSALRDGTVTSLCEAGEGTDAGRFRLTFLSANRRMRLTVDEGGTILKRSYADYSRGPRPPGA